jgi:hypothetical protein
LVVIHGAFIVSLHATAECGVISFLSASTALFPLGAHGKGRLKQHKEGQDENTRGKEGLDENSVWMGLKVTICVLATKAVVSYSFVRARKQLEHTV